MVELVVQYCGGWGYKKYYDPLKATLNQDFPDLVVSFIKDAGVTGNFEVTVKETGQLLHSKRASGVFPNSTESYAALAKKVEEVLAASK